MRRDAGCAGSLPHAIGRLTAAAIGRLATAFWVWRRVTFQRERFS